MIMHDELYRYKDLLIKTHEIPVFTPRPILVKVVQTLLVPRPILDEHEKVIFHTILHTNQS